MTVASQVSRVSYAGNGSTQNFAVPYYFLENGHLRVVLRSSAGVETTQTITTNYTVTGAGNPAGGQVSMVAAPLAGSILIIIRNVPITQETDYQANDPFPAESHERALDKLTMISQQTNEASIRSIKIPETETNNTQTPIAAQRANKLLGFSGTGDVQITSSTIADIESAVAAINTIATASPNSSANVAHISAATGAVATTVQAWLRQFVLLTDFGADKTGITSSNTPLTNAQNASQNIFVPAGTYKITSNITITSSLVMPKGALFSIDPNVTLTINGPFLAGIYQVFTGSGTVVFGGGASVIEEYPEWSNNIPVVTCYGDSFTMGVSGGITYNQAYINLIAKAKNWSIPVPPGFGNAGILSSYVGNQAFGGSQIASTEQIDRIMAHTTTDNDIQFILTGFNDMRAYGVAQSGIVTYRQTLQAALAWMAIPASSGEKFLANSSNASRVLRLGTGWTANNIWFNGQGYHTNVQGDTFNFTVFGDTIYMALPRDIFTTGICSITVDGVNYGTYNYAGSTQAVQYTKTYNMGFVRITGLTRGYHGVILTKTSATSGSDYMRVDWVAGVDGLQTAQGVMGGPQVFVGNCCRMIQAEYTDPRHGAFVQGGDGVVNAYNTIIEQCVRELAADGLNVTYVDACKYFDPNSADLDPDLVHPSAIGMQKIANAFLEKMDERKIHPKDRGVVNTGQRFINEQWTSSTLNSVIVFGEESKTSLFGAGGTASILSKNIKLVDNQYFRIDDSKPSWQVSLGVTPQILYKAAGSGQITAFDDIIELAGKFQAWITPTLTNSWVNQGTWTPARYLLDSTGFVRIGGTIKNGTIGTAAFTLPAGFRPTSTCGFPIVSNGLFGWVSINSAGVVTIEAGDNTWVSLEGIAFKV